MLEIHVSGQDLAAISEGVLQDGNTLRFLAKGHSMRPFIRNGDILMVEPMRGRPIRIADILFCKYPEQGLLVHRVVGNSHRNGQQIIITQGDALLSKDYPISSEQVLGRVVAVERGGRIICIDTVFGRALARLWVVLIPFRSSIFKAKASIKRFILSFHQA